MFLCMGGQRDERKTANQRSVHKVYYSKTDLKTNSTENRLVQF